jgi:hypothetical protein
MKKSVLISFILIFILSFSAHSTLPENFNYSRQWKKVDSLTNLGLPKSALEIVNIIYDQAKKETNDPQYVKAVVFKLRLNSGLRENAVAASVKDIQKEIAGSQEPVRQIFYSLLAEIYQSYYQNYRYRFQDRTQVLNNVSDSIYTWDLKTLTLKTVNALLLSLRNPSHLQSIPVEKFEEILVKPESTDKNNPKTIKKNNYEYRPTLYDLLSWRALDYFSGNERFEKSSLSSFMIDRVDYFQQIKEFAAMKIEFPADSFSFTGYSLKIYHDLAVFHANDNESRALIDEEIQRFGFLKENAIIDGKDSLYLDALKKLEQSHLFSPYSTDVTFTIATFLKEKGSLYHPLESQKNKWELKNAKSYCEQAIMKFPLSNGAANCRLLAKEIEKPTFQIETEYAVVPNLPSLGIIEFRNLKKLYFRIAKTDIDANQSNTSNRSRDDLVKYYSTLAFQKNWSLDLPNDGDYQSHRMEIRIPELPAGFYVVIASSDPDFKEPNQVIAWASFFSTRISFISQLNEKDREEFYILDRETGNSMSNVVVEAFTNTYIYQSRRYENHKLGEYTTDENGHFTLPEVPQGGSNQNVFLRIKFKDDLFVTGNYYLHPINKPEEIQKKQTFFFTDRAIYRPGQTVYFKGVLLEKKGTEYKILPDQESTVEFTDVDSQMIAEKKLTTNSFGSFNGSFIIPTGMLNGTMKISNGSGEITFSVEEYKRPTFEVTFQPVEGNYRLNDSITLHGSAIAYAGNNLDGASVKFRVVRAARFPFWERDWWVPMPVIPETEILNGVLKTAGDGSFNIKFKAIPDLSVEKSKEPVFDYMVYADVTDINGETQSGSQSVSAGYVSLLVGIDVPDNLDPSRDSIFHFSATNLNGRKTPITVTMNIQRLHQPDQIYRQREWTKPDLFGMTEKEFHSAFPVDLYSDENVISKWPVEQDILKKEINTGKDSIFRISQIAHFSNGEWKTVDGKKLIPGNYILTLNATDPFGEKVERKISFVIYDPASAQVPVQDIDWFVPIKTSGEPGEKAKFLIGSKAENVYVRYGIWVHDTLFSNQLIKLNNNQVVVEIPIKEQFRGNFFVNCTFIRYNRSFQHTTWVHVPYTNKKLDIKFETFRNKLYPGQNEEWKIRVSDAAKKGVEAEYLTTMYDASLDVYDTKNWSFSILDEYFWSYLWETTSSFRTSSGMYYPLRYESSQYYSPTYEEFDWFGFDLVNSGNFRGYKSLGVSMSQNSRVKSPLVSYDQTITPVEEYAKESNLPSATPPPKPPSMDGDRIPTGNNTKKTGQSIGIQIRRDFRETAFFYPTLVTDSAGNLDIKFTVPESLTKWKILGFAYTKNLAYGLIEKELITHKDLMVFPNAPRFVRQGDTLIFSAKVVNLSDHDLIGEVVLELSDALTQKSVSLVTKGNSTQQFSIKTGQSAAIQWVLAIPVDPSLSLLQYRVTARSGDFSDGEEKVFPVLSNRILVTESLPLPLRGKGPAEFKFDKLINSSNEKSISNYKLTLDFASNPVWYAIQALPTMDESRFPNADNIFRVYYTNSIANFLANSNPSIKQVFESWKTLSKDALVSNLMKNESLKSALLQETPWVMEAQDESQRKYRLGLFFDPAYLSSKLPVMLNKLEKLQVSSGAWPWFEGMPESRYITQEIVTGLGHLDHLGIKNIRNDKETWNMLSKAIEYLDGELLKDYNNLKKYYPGKMDDDHLSPIQIQYLYARSYFIPDIPLISGGDLKTAFQYFERQAEKYWLKNQLYSQGMIALALNRLGNKTIPAAILKSLSENALHSNEMGMYWASQSSYEWYQAPIETQALLIEAYQELSSDKQPVDEMKIWLLKQKQTQDWKTGRATAEACYALLLRGTDLLSEHPNVKIELGNENIDAEKIQDTKVEAGTGYFQIFRNGKEISPEMGNVKVSKSTDGIAWGALYWQYFEDIDKITPQASPLKVEKKLFIERITPSGKVLVPVMTKDLPIDKKSGNEGLKVGDKIVVRIVLAVDRNLEFVHMKDMRASAFEPLTSEQMSGYRYQDGLGYYQSTTDVSTNFFFDYLPKGTWVFEYSLMINAAGDYSNGITTVQCMYTPEFGAHSEGLKVKVGN